MSFEQEFMHGYEKYTENFDKWCEKARSVLGHVTQCGIGEVDSSGHALIATNRPDFGEHYIDKCGYTLEKKYTYSEDLPEGFLVSSSDGGIQFLQNNQESLFGKQFDLWHGFLYSEKIDDNIHRYYSFGSDSPEIYNKLLNNMLLIKQFIRHFKKENEHIVEYYRERKFNVAEKKDNYFISGNDGAHISEKDKLVNMLHTLNLLDRNMNITNREWQCLQLYCQGKSASQTGEALGISRRTVETHFEHLKTKLNVNSKSELIDVVS